jgi:hypothetical protein
MPLQLRRRAQPQLKQSPSSCLEQALGSARSRKRSPLKWSLSNTAALCWKVNAMRLEQRLALPWLLPQKPAHNTPTARASSRAMITKLRLRSSNPSSVMRARNATD